jgi:hypothetical protein
VWGAAIAAVGLSTFSFALGLGFLVIAGAADIFSTIFRATILQVAVPDALRGRLSALHIMVVTGGPRLGDLEATAVASVVSAQFSVVSGGLLCLVGVAAVALAFPTLLHYDADVALAEAQRRDAEVAAASAGPTEDQLWPPSTVRRIVPSTPASHATRRSTAARPRNCFVVPVGTNRQAGEPGAAVAGAATTMAATRANRGTRARSLMPGTVVITA